ncbi:hypothetical protein DL770_006454 [Monosporascus sp. CRB-9-2]|nr:hypothetical protein DL770_006454 [Monosporascus sp. CRB-9-2]
MSGLLFLFLLPALAAAKIVRHANVSKHNVVRSRPPEIVGNITTPFQVDNGDFAFQCRIGLRYKGESLARSLTTEPQQKLDIWNGVITSTFKVVKVLTQGDLDSDAAIFDIESELVSSGDLGVELDFRYPARAQRTPALPSTIRKHNTADWNQYWNEGGFVDLTESSNPTAAELQRRIILMQYHMRFNSAATGQSPQESRLVYNGWTQNMGWEGARWPKMAELGTGGIAPGVTENSDPLHTKNLAYEIVHWRWGLDTDAELKRLLGQPAPEKWTTVAENLAPPPQVDGMYMPCEGLNSS